VRVVFMGTPEFAVPSLRLLAASHDVVAVYTRPDAVSGRGSGTRPSPVKVASHELGLSIEQPPTLRDSGAQQVLAGYRPDLCVVAAYGLILPLAVLEIPRLGCVNVHASLLPRWRGAAPVQRAILAGDTETGISIMRMEEGLDTGPFCEIERVPVAEKSAPQLASELADAGARALARALVRIEAGTCEWVVQDESQATYAAKLTKTEVVLMPGLSAQDALRRVRASGPQAPARATIAGRGVTVAHAVLWDGDIAEGAVEMTPSGVVLGFADAALVVDRVKPDGKREMVAADWGRGMRLGPDATWASA